MRDPEVMWGANPYVKSGDLRDLSGMAYLGSNALPPGASDCELLRADKRHRSPRVHRSKTALTSASALVRWCRRGDSNPHVLSDTRSLV